MRPLDLIRAFFSGSPFSRREREEVRSQINFCRVAAEWTAVRREVTAWVVDGRTPGPMWCERLPRLEERPLGRWIASGARRNFGDLGSFSDFARIHRQVCGDVRTIARAQAQGDEQEASRSFHHDFEPHYRELRSWLVHLADLFDAGCAQGMEEEFQFTQPAMMR